MTSKPTIVPTKKTVLITGCSAGGIGAALADAFHQKGYHVFATARTPSKIPETLSRSPNVTVITLDVLSSVSIADAVVSVGSKLDVLVNNSGGGYTIPALDTSIEEGKKLFDLNYWAPLAMLQAFAPLLINAKGCIVNNTSANAYLPMPLMSNYNASKAALAIASETWRHELQPLGVRTVTLITCAVKTNAFADYHAPEIPNRSPYSAIRELIKRITDGSLQKGAISAEKYADDVVSKVEKGAVGTVWVGTDALMARLVLGVLPQWIIDMVVQSIIPIAQEMAKAGQKKD